MRGIEFHTDPMTGEVMYKTIGGSVIKELAENDNDIIEYVLSASEAFYPDQYQAVSKEYEKSSPNKKHYDFLRARRIINCCFGENDRQLDIDEFGNYNFEMVKCPRMAECLYHKIICQPRFESNLTERELEIMGLYFKHLSTEKIAAQLFLSIHTVNNHRRNALRRLKLHSLEEFIDYAHRNKLFETVHLTQH